MVYPLRIALVASSFAPYIGGVEQHTAQVAAELRARGHFVEVWTVARDGHPAIRTVEGITVRDLPTPLPARDIGAGMRFVVSAPLALMRWVKAWRSFRPQVFHVQCFGPNGLYAHAMSSLTRTPQVVSSHGETEADDNDIFRTSLLLPHGLRRALGAASAVTGCSASVANDLRDHYGAEQVVIVPNGVSNLDVGEIRRVRGRVVGVGRLETHKGFDLLIRAVAQIETAELVLVGDGRQREVLRALAEELQIADRVDFIGVLSSLETRRAMAQSEVVVVPSRKESFGIVALEAWSAGTPLVATSTCGPAYFVTQAEDALMVDPEDTAALAQVIRSVLADDNLAARLVSGGREAVRGYTWGAVVARYEDLYRHAVERSVGPS